MTWQQDVALYRHCPWMVPHVYDWFFQGPAIIVLAINVMFLFTIMWVRTISIFRQFFRFFVLFFLNNVVTLSLSKVLITKLRSANTVETQQYRKASKALLVLIPLLGVTYILVLAGPTEGQVANVFSYARAVLLSCQVEKSFFSKSWSKLTL